MTELKDNIKILIMSFGSIGKRHASNMRKLLPNAKIAVFRQYYSEVEESFEYIDTFFFDANDAIKFEPDILVVASPASLHIENIKPFLGTKTNLFIEKPLSNNTTCLSELNQLVAQHPGFCMVGYVLRFLPALRAIKQCVQQNTLGAIYTAYVQVGQYLPDWRPSSDYRKGVSANSSLGGGVLLELSHEIDYVTWLFGQPSSVFCHHNSCSDLQLDVEDNAHLILDYNGKKSVVLQLDFLQRVPQMELQIVGQKGTLKSDLINEKATLITPEQPAGLSLEIEPAGTFNDVYLYQFDYFLANSLPCYQTQYDEKHTQTDIATISHSTELLYIIESARLSNETRQMVSLSRGKFHD